MNYRCANCKEQFGSREYVCEDRTDPKKSFLCPHCRAYLQPVPLKFSRQNFAISLLVLVPLNILVMNSGWLNYQVVKFVGLSLIGVAICSYLGNGNLSVRETMVVQ